MTFRGLDFFEAWLSRGSHGVTFASEKSRNMDGVTWVNLKFFWLVGVVFFENLRSTVSLLVAFKVNL